MRRSTLLLVLGVAALASFATLLVTAPRFANRRERGYAGFDAVPAARPALPARTASADRAQLADQLSTVAFTAPQVAAATPSMIIRTGRAAIEVDSLETAVALLRELAARLGGHVANTSM
ncbi:MAG: hypothetical protein ACREMV_13470, partial [Gemmatimonadales bacterium]